jgi:hypothetical protein
MDAIALLALFSYLVVGGIMAIAILFSLFWKLLTKILT